MPHCKLHWPIDKEGWVGLLVLLLNPPKSPATAWVDGTQGGGLTGPSAATLSSAVWIQAASAAFRPACLLESGCTERQYRCTENGVACLVRRWPAWNTLIDSSAARLEHQSPFLVMP